MALDNFISEDRNFHKDRAFTSQNLAPELEIQASMMFSGKLVATSPPLSLTCGVEDECFKTEKF